MGCEHSRYYLAIGDRALDLEHILKSKKPTQKRAGFIDRQERSLIMDALEPLRQLEPGHLREQFP